MAIIGVVMIILKNGNIVDIYTGEIVKGNIGIQNGKIAFVDLNDQISNEFHNSSIGYKVDKVIDLKGKYVSPTFIDSHIHIESSHLIPSEFEKYALLNGVTKVVIDPHEIANVLGIDGIKFMLNDAKILNVFLMVPSCVPATALETNGAEITAKDIEKLFKYNNRILGLGEVMNYIGVINGDKEVLEKIEVAKRYNKLIDGHCPQLTGLELCKYIEKGIMSDHECVEPEETLEKLRLGLKIIVREGSASKNIDILKIREKINDMRNLMLVSDDISAKDLKNGYMLNILKKATKYVSPVEAIQMVTINPGNYFGFDVGIKPSNEANLIIFDDLNEFKVSKIMVNGKFLDELLNNNNYNNHDLNQKNKSIKKLNTIHYDYKNEEDFLINGIDSLYHQYRHSDFKIRRCRAIKPINNSLITKEKIIKLDDAKEKLNDRELNRIAVVERHKNTNRIGKGLVVDFLKRGTLASSYSHDSHNVVVVGNDPADMAVAVNFLKDIGGGFVAVENGKVVEYVMLNVAGIMGDDGEYILRKTESLEEKTKDWSDFENIFLSMSFLTLPVIPELKITDMGLVKNMEIVDLLI